MVGLKKGLLGGSSNPVVTVSLKTFVLEGLKKEFLQFIVQGWKMFELRRGDVEFSWF